MRLLTRLKSSLQAWQKDKTASRFGEREMEDWHYTDLIKAHKLFIELEGRFRFYDAYIKATEPRVWLKSPDVPLKEGLLLFGWVHSWDPNFQGDLGRFYQIHEDIYGLLKGFEGKTILNVDLDDYVKNSLCSIFDRVANCCRKPRFESTDASKMLHALIPDLFVMWDDKIRQGILGDRNRKYGRDYAYEFLPKMQNFAKQFLDTYIRENGGDHEHASKQISQIADGYTLAKLLDELNYLRFTKGKTLAEIRSVSLSVFGGHNP